MESIVVKGARTNNLKNVDVEIPLESFVCFTGVSGCGKSSLVFDTIFAESQRAFLEGISGNLYGNQIMDKPDVDYIDNLKPSVNLSQNYYNNNPRSTVGSVSEISYYLRALFSMIAADFYEEQILPNKFSPNVAEGCCLVCKGIGTEHTVDLEKVIINKTCSLSDGAISYFAGTPNSFSNKLLVSICDYYGIDIHSSISELTKEQLDNILYNDKPVALKIRYKNTSGKYKTQTRYTRGVIKEIEEQIPNLDTPSVYTSVYRYLKEQPCSACEGKKYSDMILGITLEEKSIADIEGMPLDDLYHVLKKWKKLLSKRVLANQYIQILDSIIKRLESLRLLNLGYIALSRTVPTLSGGEIQRIRVANQLNCCLSGLVYILDEPCRGLHIKNIDSIISSIRNLIEKGNTVISIEHNTKFISAADRIYELGPVGGTQGGYLLDDNVQSDCYVYDIKFHEPRKQSKYIQIKKMSYHNIYKQDFKVPEGVITCITGVSGSGKSSFVKALSEAVNDEKQTYCESVTSSLKNAIYVNQQPIGKNSRSTIVTYLDIYNDIRDIFAETSKAKELKVCATDFSFNVEGGRCECCQGTGYKRIEMNYLPDSYILCPECSGKRFKKNVLEVKYNDCSITDVLSKTIEDVIEMFSEHSGIVSKLKCMIDIGLGYLALGDMTSKLSGGESQRVKLAKELGKKTRNKVIYILDEPTAGLHRKDIEKIKGILNSLVDKGNTIIIVEHNVEFIAEMSDAVIDFGMKSGDEGGKGILYNSAETAFNDEKSSLHGIIL